MGTADVLTALGAHAATAADAHLSAAGPGLPAGDAGSLSHEV